MNKSKEYKNIEFFKREFDDNYLLLLNNKTLSVGFIVKDILLLLQHDILNSHQIKSKLSGKYNLEIDIEDIEKTISVINKFTFDKTDSFFIRFCKLFNPSSISLNLNFIFNKTVFYFSFVFVLILNVLMFASLQHGYIENFKDWLIWLFLLVIVLFSHELGHSLSAKKYGVDCKEIGVGLYFIFPILYTNLGESWKLKKWKRIIINFSGIYFQFIVGAIIGSLAWFMDSNILLSLFFTNFAIILININPFIKLDGYWIVADLLNTGNLSQAANKEFTNAFSFKLHTKRNIKLLIYAFFRLIFIIVISAIMVSLVFSIIMKIYHLTPLSYREYLFIIFIVFYIFKYKRNRK